MFPSNISSILSWECLRTEESRFSNMKTFSWATHCGNFFSKLGAAIDAERNPKALAYGVWNAIFNLGWFATGKMVTHKRDSRRKLTDLVSGNWHEQQSFLIERPWYQVLEQEEILPSSCSASPSSDGPGVPYSIHVTGLTVIFHVFSTTKTISGICNAGYKSTTFLIKDRSPCEHWTYARGGWPSR